MVQLYKQTSNIYQSEDDPNGKKSLPPDHVVT